MTRTSRMIRILTVAVFMSSTWALGQRLTTIYNFGSDARDGADPLAGVVFDNAGNLFGMAAIGGHLGGNGMIFKLSPTAQVGSPWIETVIHQFHGVPDGNSPESRVTFLPDGKIVGTTSRGGANDLGTVFVAFQQAHSDSWTTRVVYNFGGFSGDGLNPNTGLLKAAGSFYGVTTAGGAKHRGTVYQMTPSANLKDPWTETVLYSFQASGDAAFPAGELAIDRNGNLFGTALQGGVNNLGAIYEVSPPAVPGDPWTETVVYSFNGSDGTLPSGRLIFDASGALYGTTDGGGSQQEGTVFKLSPPVNPGDSWTETVLFNFSGGREGGNPEAGVTMDKTGRLFGAASSGGSGGPDFGGVVFRLDPPAVEGDPWTETVLHSFGGPDGFSSASPLLLRNDGIYGTTTLGGDFGTGTVFVLKP